MSLWTNLVVIFPDMLFLGVNKSALVELSDLWLSPALKSNEPITVRTVRHSKCVLLKCIAESQLSFGFMGFFWDFKFENCQMVFIRYMKLWHKVCLLWIKSCSRPQHQLNKINKGVYVCSKASQHCMRPHIVTLLEGNTKLSLRSLVLAKASLTLAPNCVVQWPILF